MSFQLDENGEPFPEPQTLNDVLKLRREMAKRSAEEREKRQIAEKKNKQIAIQRSQLENNKSQLDNKLQVSNQWIYFIGLFSSSCFPPTGRYHFRTPKARIVKLFETLISVKTQGRFAVQTYIMYLDYLVGMCTCHSTM